jgi:hypothetical protein
MILKINGEFLGKNKLSPFNRAGITTAGKRYLRESFHKCKIERIIRFWKAIANRQLRDDDPNKED